jgi:hypothetical protein
MRYKNKPITPVDAVRWNGENLDEVKTICPEAEKPGPALMLWIPGPEETIEVYVTEYVMKNVGTGTYSKLGENVFAGLYMPSEVAETQPAGE